MSTDINKHLLSHFYGFNEDCREARFLSSSKGIESFENTTDIECISSEHLLSSEEIGKNQNAEEELEKVYDEKNETNLSKSPHILTIQELLEENENAVDSPRSHLETDIIEDLKDDKIVPTKNFTKLEDTFTKAMAKISESPVQGDTNIISNNSSSNVSSRPVKKAKKLWRQKTMLSKENLLTSSNLLSKFSGVYLDLNNAGIYTFPVDILPQVVNLQMLYLDSNDLMEIPHELFTILKYLKWLDVRNNQLATVPSSIKGHKHLETLLLQGNNIEELPLELGLVAKLKNLQTAHNPLTFPPQEILDLDCSSIINFLRNEWNKRHPNEIMELIKINNDKIEKKSSTIICYQPTSKNSYKVNKYRTFQNKEPKMSVRSRTWNYKPSSRCLKAGGDIALQQKVLWINTAKKLLNEQAAEIQKSIDKSVLDMWRNNYKLSKDHTISLKPVLNPPFALHMENSQKNIDKGEMNSKLQYDYLSSRNFNEKFNEFIESLKKLNGTSDSGHMTPHSEQKRLQSEIEMITELQRKLKGLKLYNDYAVAPYKGIDNAQKKYTYKPSIII